VVIGEDRSDLGLIELVEEEPDEELEDDDDDEVD
jgi:hypothetical protein